MSGESPSYPAVSTAALTDRFVRPGSVTVSIALTWVGAFVCALLGALMLARAGDKNLLDGYEGSVGRPIDRDRVSGQLRLLGAVMVPWGVVVIAVAARAGQGRGWARVALTVLGASCCVVAAYLTTSYGGLGGPVTVTWVAICVGLLWTPSARAWYAAHNRAAMAYDARLEPPLSP